VTAIPLESSSGSPLVHFRWDLDKTYIHTEFDTLRMLVGTWLQTAEQKRTIAGASNLLRELIAAQSPDGHRVTFISGSPRQMRKVLAERLRLDGIVPHRFILKPNLSNLLLFRFKAIRSQIGYKLAALLESHVDADRVDELLFGDDAEQDALIYSLYGDLVSGRATRGDLRWVLEASNVEPREAELVLAAYDRLERVGNTRIARIFIHLARRSPTSRFEHFGARVVPVFNWMQAAVVLHADGFLPGPGLQRVVGEMHAQEYSAARLANSLQDLVRRGFVSIAAVDALVSALHETSGVRPSDSGPCEKLAREIGALDLPRREPAPFYENIDYVAACREVKKYRRLAEPLGGIGWLR
jgi:hypothetical protein